MHRNVFAYTAPGCDMPEFVSINAGVLTGIALFAALVFVVWAFSPPRDLRR